MNTKKWMYTLTAALLVLLSTAAQAQILPAPDFKLTIQLQPTRYGAVCGTNGYATIGREGGVEVFRIVLATKHVDNTEMMVVGLNSQEQWFKIGAVTMSLGKGQLEIRQPANTEGSLLFPITNLKRVVVYEGGTRMLNGSFSVLPAG